MFYRGPSFLDSAAHPPLPSSVSKLDWRHTGRLRKRDNLLTGEGGGRGAKSYDQREGMGLLEHQAMPSLRDVAHDRWLCTFTIIQQLETQSARSWAAPVWATGTVQKRQAVRPVHHVQNYICRVTLLQPARQAAMLGQPSSLRPHCI
jgi:hypothetical protein